MSDNDVERELVLGNKQLLTIFFVGVLLCGVFFVMGYVVGGNSAKSAATTAAADAQPPVSSDEGKRRQPQASGQPDNSASTASQNDTAAQLPSPEPKISDNPTAAGTQPQTAVNEQPPATVASAPVPKPVAASPASTGVALSEPEKGASYIQVTAQRRPEADDVVKALREGRYPAILASSSKPDLFEVLVGPYRSAPALAEAKGKLKSNFNDLIVRKF